MNIRYVAVSIVSAKDLPGTVGVMTDIENRLPGLDPATDKRLGVRVAVVVDESQSFSLVSLRGAEIVNEFLLLSRRVEEKP
jgi:hypothetical protein